VNDVEILISSFFRFGHGANGIYRPLLDPVTFSGSVSVVPVFRQEEESIGPLFSFRDMNESVLTSILESSVLTIKYAKKRVTCEMVFESPVCQKHLVHTHSRFCAQFAAVCCERN
jgi:hypothetical protein